MADAAPFRRETTLPFENEKLRNPLAPCATLGWTIAKAPDKVDAPRHSMETTALRRRAGGDCLEDIGVNFLRFLSLAHNGLWGDQSNCEEKKVVPGATGCSTRVRAKAYTARVDESLTLTASVRIPSMISLVVNE
jgi:hypothetical protein